MRTPKLNRSELGGRISALDIKPGNNGFFGTITIAADDGYFKKNDTGPKEWVDRVHFIDVKVEHTFLGLFKEPLAVGDELTLVGKLVRDVWKDKQTNENRYATRIQAEYAIQHVRKVEVECLKQNGLVGGGNQNNQGGYAPQQNNQGGYAPQPNSQGGFAPRQNNAPQPNSQGGYGKQNNSSYGG
jgi:single-strand DNA-binding protein